MLTRRTAISSALAALFAPLLGKVCPANPLNEGVRYFHWPPPTTLKPFVVYMSKVDDPNNWDVEMEWFDLSKPLA